jgi:hypothetical protein
MSDLEIQRAANLWLRQHRENATAKAREGRATSLLRFRQQWAAAMSIQRRQ